MYPISAGAGFRSPYPTSLPISSTTLPSDFYRFSPTSLLPGHPGLSPHGHHSLSSHPAIVTPGPKQELGHHTQSDHNHRWVIKIKTQEFCQYLNSTTGVQSSRPRKWGQKGWNLMLGQFMLGHVEHSYGSRQNRRARDTKIKGVGFWGDWTGEGRGSETESTPIWLFKLLLPN